MLAGASFSLFPDCRPPQWILSCPQAPGSRWPWRTPWNTIEAKSHEHQVAWGWVQSHTAARTSEAEEAADLPTEAVGVYSLLLLARREALCRPVPVPGLLRSEATAMPQVHGGIQSLSPLLSWPPLHRRSGDFGVNSIFYGFQTKSLRIFKPAKDTC